MRRQLSARTASLLARLAAPWAQESSAAVRTLRVVASAQPCQVTERSHHKGSEPCSTGGSGGGSSWRGRERSFASAAAEPAVAPPEKAGLIISAAAAQRLKELGSDVVLRVMVEGGGCSGFQYEFSLDEAPKEDDRVFEKDGAKVVCDDLSLEFLRGATVDYESDLMRSAFVVNSNPNAASSCGCGSSFVAK